MEFSLQSFKTIKIIDAKKHHCGNLTNIMLNTENGQITAFQYNQTHFFHKNDIINWNKKEIQIATNHGVNNDYLNETNLKPATKLINMDVYTVSRDFVGKVKSITFESSFYSIKFIKVTHTILLLLKLRTFNIPLKKIIEIKNKEIIIEDIFEKEICKNIQLIPVCE